MFRMNVRLLASASRREDMEIKMLQRRKSENELKDGRKDLRNIHTDEQKYLPKVGSLSSRPKNVFSQPSAE